MIPEPPVIAWWFLRSRGDAPFRIRTGGAGMKVPPLTRRCAARGVGRGPARGGSSAHAEMRPLDMLAVFDGPGFLRSRGDAPEKAWLSPDEWAVPPLTRRCARRSRGRRVARDGSSAHAEMRPTWPRSGATRRRFLRSRGDAPMTLRRGFRRSSVPPLTRRCAQCARGPSCGGRGSSAHAEMRRRQCQWSPDLTRFLRSRGDAPPEGRSPLRCSLVPPLTRRCALRRAWHSRLR